MRLLFTLIFLVGTIASQGQVAEVLLPITFTSELSQKLDRIYWNDSTSYDTFCRQYRMGVTLSEQADILKSKKLPPSCADTSNYKLKNLRGTNNFIVSIWWYPKLDSHVNTAIYLGLSPNVNSNGQDIVLPQMRLVDIRQELDSIEYAIIINQITQAFKISVGRDETSEMEEHTIRKIAIDEMPQLSQCPKQGLIKMILDKTNMGLLQPCLDNQCNTWITMTEFETAVGTQHPVAFYISDHWDLKEPNMRIANFTPWGYDLGLSLLSRTTLSLAVEFENGAVVWYAWDNIEEELNVSQEWPCGELYRSYLESTFYQKLKLQLIEKE